MAAWRYAFACSECPRAIIRHPMLTCLHACNVPILTCSSQVAPICTLFTSKGQHVKAWACLFAHLLYPKAVTWDCFWIRSCLHTCCLSESPNGNQDITVCRLPLHQGQTWQPEHISLKIYSVPAPVYMPAMSQNLPCTNLTCLFPYLPYHSATICRCRHASLQVCCIPGLPLGGL